MHKLSSLTLALPLSAALFLTGCVLSAGSWYRGYGSVVLPVSG
ncbi:hypothetical protein ACL1CS_10625 [Corynebacterium striatum]